VTVVEVNVIVPVALFQIPCAAALESGNPAAVVMACVKAFVI
jgi:hypothetical protein